MTHDEARELAAAFVLRALTPEEEQAVRDHLASCDLSHDEFAELGGVAAVLADALPPVEPPPGLKARLLAAAAEDLEARSAAGTVGTSGAADGAPERVPESVEPGAVPGAVPADAGGVSAFPSAEEREARRRGFAVSPSWLLGLAAAIAIVALGVWNLNLQGELGRIRGDVGILQARLDAAERLNLSVATVLDAASQPGSTTAILLPPEGAAGPRGLATVQPDGTVLLAMLNLEPTQGQRVYEAWVIAGSAAPVPVGNFQVGSDGTASVTFANTPAAPGVTLALTVEPGPGATTPTMPIRSLGIVSGGTG